MGAMSQLHMEITDRLLSGAGTVAEIAKSLNVPVQWVIEIEDELLQTYNDSMDGDEASALASAGFGTDEDYGGFAEDF